MSTPRVSLEEPPSDASLLAEVLSLLCPISGKRIKVGCKGRSCDHAQCFDRAVRAHAHKHDGEREREKTFF